MAAGRYHSSRKPQACRSAAIIRTAARSAACYKRVIMRFILQVFAALIPFLIIPAAALSLGFLIGYFAVGWSVWLSLGLSVVLFFPIWYLLNLLGLLSLIPAALSQDSNDADAAVKTQDKRDHYRQKYAHIPDGTGRDEH